VLMASVDAILSSREIAKLAHENRGNKKKRKEISYNLQITVDHDSGIILANDVTQDGTDHYQLHQTQRMVRTGTDTHSMINSFGENRCSVLSC